MTRSRYVKAPQPSEEVRQMYQAVLAVLSAQLTVTQAAQTVSLSRLRFQTRLHRGLNGLLEALADQPRGRPSTPETEKALREEVTRLRADNQRLTKQVESTARMMGLASEWMHKGLRSAGRQRRTPVVSAESPPSESDEDPARKRLEAVLAMSSDGVRIELAAVAVGVSAPTVRRWRAREKRGTALCNKRGPHPGTRPNVAVKEQAKKALLDARGCMGAVALSKATGLSRRDAASVRAGVLTELEKTRREAASRLEVAPGVIRGFDAVMLGKTPLLAAADGAIPYRTWLQSAPAYDAEAVRAAIARDLEQNTAPLIWRMDRAKAHTTPEVLEVLNAHQVLVLQGPPRCPQFYGQLERQNREHRAWLNWLDELTTAELSKECERMRECFNEVVPRRSLGWRTAGAAWRSREQVVVDRRELAEEVAERQRRLEEEVVSGRKYPGLIERLAIQATLTKRGLLRLTKGGWC